MMYVCGDKLSLTSILFRDQTIEINCREINTVRNLLTGYRLLTRRQRHLHVHCVELHGVRRGSLSE